MGSLSLSLSLFYLVQNKIIYEFGTYNTLTQKYLGWDIIGIASTWSS
jgi:hypothetical protein